MNEKKYRVSTMVVRYMFILLGSILTAAGLEVFFKAHNLIGGGIIGIAVIISYLGELPLSLIIVVLNFPFLFKYRRYGKGMIISTLFAITSLIYWMSVLNPAEIEPQDILHSTLLGGICLGVGSGLVLRYGGFLDGMELQRKVFKLNMLRPVNKYFILINLMILSVSGFVFSWENAIYSLIAYLIVFKAIDITLELFYKTGEAIIISNKNEEVAQNILNRLGKRVTFINYDEGQGPNNKILCPNVSNHELGALKSIIYDVDKEASVFLTNDKAIY